MSSAERVCRLARFALTTANASKLAGFYENAFGFRRLNAEYVHGPEFEHLMGIRGGANVITLCLGNEILDLFQFDRPGRPYPIRTSASDLIFQHFAIVTGDIGWAWQRLRAAGGWSAITHDAPQLLPKSSGGVAAFKFRDPDGHPLELLAFPAENTPPKWRATKANATCLGIDHSALSVSDTATSTDFYQGLGFQISARSFNQGPEQEALDDISEVHVDVTALVPAVSAPHLELLCYRCKRRSRARVCRSNDIAATRLVLELCGSGDEDPNYAPRSLLDPDAHRLITIPIGGANDARD